LVPSKSEARRAVQQGGVSVDGEKINDIKATYDAAAIGDGIVLKKGKKNFRKILL
ncbi:MAG: tyrosine--tRNA ligase, partial [Eubacterium sp.]|nr:tyrosine--tRNA ligase [Eubacterium sp.]